MGDTQVFVGFSACALRQLFGMFLLWGWFWSPYSGTGGYSQVVTGVSRSPALLEQSSFDISLKRQKILCSLLLLQTFKYLMKSMILFIFPFPSRQMKNKTWTRTFSPKPFFRSINICDIEIVKIWMNFRATVIAFPVLHPSIGNDFLQQPLEVYITSSVLSKNVCCLSHFKLEREL